MDNLCVAVAAVAMCVSDNAPADSPYLVDADKRYYCTRSNACGIVSSFLLLRSLGRDADMDALADELRPSAAGNTMTELCDVLSKRGLKVTAVDIDSATVRGILESGSSVRVIALLNSKHWVFLRPGDNGLEAYTYPRWRRMSPSDFSSRFTGKAILVGNVPSPVFHSESVLVGVVLIMWSCVGLVGVTIRRRSPSF